MLSCVQLFVTPWTVAQLGPLSVEFSRQEHWSGLPFPSPGDLPDPGIKPGSSAFQVDSLSSELPGEVQPKKKKKIRAKQCKTESWIAWYDEAENINRSIEGSVMSWHYLVFRKYLLKETYILSIDKEEPVVCLLNYSCRSYHQPHHDSLGLSSPKEVSYSLPTSQFCCP